MDNDQRASLVRATSLHSLEGCRKRAGSTTTGLHPLVGPSAVMWPRIVIRPFVSIHTGSLFSCCGATRYAETRWWFIGAVFHDQRFPSMPLAFMNWHSDTSPARNLVNRTFKPEKATRTPPFACAGDLPTLDAFQVRESLSIPFFASVSSRWLLAPWAAYLNNGSLCLNFTLNFKHAFATKCIFVFKVCMQTWKDSRIA